MWFPQPVVPFGRVIDGLSAVVGDPTFQFNLFRDHLGDAPDAGPRRSDSFPPRQCIGAGRLAPIHHGPHGTVARSLHLPDANRQILTRTHCRHIN
jgi:hypothetical protein